MDYLPIQASSVPLLMEALQMMKFFLKKECLNFMAGWATLQHDMQQEINRDILAKVVDTHLSKEELMQVVDDIMVMIAGDEGNRIEL
ncbi:hypothetical protein EDD16DRAFT_1711604 [Pisolithus croceorrhizus]|nr:hypothetical protein EV401DRAFT_2083087 [Pisolithus croceorrhizus]KAI6109062.1 hypothetical protein EDD16DRAFT_1711604 [Pisolithus croceorrhizus]KAI6147567.1 hypothetical protein EDD17DRAFT_1767323 [Pisolithus thermaeus]